MIYYVDPKPPKQLVFKKSNKEYSDNINSVIKTFKLKFNIFFRYRICNLSVYWKF